MKKRKEKEFKWDFCTTPEKYWDKLEGLTTLSELGVFCKANPGAEIVLKGRNLRFLITEKIDDYIKKCTNKRSDGAMFTDGWAIPPERRDSKVFRWNKELYVVPENWVVDLIKGQITYLYQ